MTERYTGRMREVPPKTDRQLQRVANNAAKQVRHRSNKAARAEKQRQDLKK